MGRFNPDLHIAAEQARLTLRRPFCMSVLVTDILTVPDRTDRLLIFDSEACLRDGLSANGICNLKATALASKPEKHPGRHIGIAQHTRDQDRQFEVDLIVA